MTKQQKIINNKRKASLFYKVLLEIQSKTLSNSNIIQNLVITGTAFGNSSSHLIIYYCSLKKINFLQRDIDKTIPIFKRELANIIGTKRIPNLIFKQDKSHDEGTKIDKILKNKNLLV